MTETATIEKFLYMSTAVLEELLNQLSVDPEKFEDDIAEIKQELIIRSLNICRPVIDLI